MLQHVKQGWPNERNIVQHGGQTHAVCRVQQCCTMLHQNVASVWPGLKIDKNVTLRLSLPARRTNIISMGSDSGTATGVSLQYQNLLRLRVALSDNRTWTIAPSNLPDHKWNHVTISWHEAWGLKYYLNGVYKNGTNKWIRDLESNFAVADRIIVGGGESELDGTSFVGENVQISDLRLWQNYLHSSDIKDKFNQPGNHFGLDVQHGCYWEAFVRFYGGFYN